MTAPESAPAALQEVEWRIYLDTPSPVPCVGYRALNDLLKGEFKGKVTKIQHKGINGKWYDAKRGKK